MNFALKTMDFVLKMMNLWTTVCSYLAANTPPERRSLVINDEFCIKDDEFCIKDDELCIKNDEFCMNNCRSLVISGYLFQITSVRIVGTSLYPLWYRRNYIAQIP